MTIHFPLFITEKDPRVPEVTLYTSFEEIEESLEEIDVENQEYIIWDNSGKRLDLKVMREGTHWLTILPTEIEDISGLVEAVLKYADAVGMSSEEQEKLGKILPNDALTCIYEFEEETTRRKQAARRKRWSWLIPWWK